MSVIPEGKKLRKAVKWVSDERLEKPEAGLARLISDACVKFDLPPKDAEFLMRFFTEKDSD